MYYAIWRYRYTHDMKKGSPVVLFFVGVSLLLAAILIGGDNRRAVCLPVILLIVLAIAGVRILIQKNINEKRQNDN